MDLNFLAESSSSSNTNYTFSPHQWYPYSYPTKTGYNGALIELLKAAERFYGYCFIQNVQSNVNWGTRQPNGTWTGVFSLIVYNQTDFGVGPYPVGSQALEVVDFSHTLYYVDKRIAYKRPTIEPNLKGFIEPFTLLSWELILLCVLLVGLCSAVVYGSLGHEFQEGSRAATEPSGRGHPGMCARIMRSTQNNFLWTIGILLGQDPHGAIRVSRSAVVIAVTWLLMSFILGSMYKSTLISMLVMPKIQIPFDNFEELVRQDDIKWKLFPYTSEYRALMDAPANTVLGKARTKLGGVVYTVEESEKNILEDNAAIIASDVGIKTFMEKNFAETGECQVTVARGSMMSMSHFAMAFPKGSPLKPNFDMLILRLRQHGLMDYWLYDRIRKGYRCFTPPDLDLGPTLRPLTLEDFYGVFMLYTSGVFLGGVAFLVENVVGRIQRK
ncbi:putative glutamate receptor [Oratosquilla oratoria]|uniref:putative glutamate receptor n=1 Tax=Oratosquilla oratoria TaxID=337810 RepID=UPI003F763894